MFVRLPTIVARWPATTLLFGIHAALVVLLYFGWRFSVDPEREMMWLWTLILDFPIGFAYLYCEVPSHFLTAIISIVLGGLGWALVGWLLDLLRKRYSSTSSLRGQRHI